MDYGDANKSPSKGAESEGARGDSTEMRLLNGWRRTGEAVCSLKFLTDTLSWDTGANLSRTVSPAIMIPRKRPEGAHEEPCRPDRGEYRYAASKVARTFPQASVKGGNPQVKWHIKRQLTPINQFFGHERLREDRLCGPWCQLAWGTV